MITLYITSGLSLIAATVAAYLFSQKKHTLRLIAKSLASLLFCATGLLAILMRASFSKYAIGVMTALILGLVGDIFLCLDSLIDDPKNSMLMNGIGLLAFLAGHVFFIIIFMLEAPFKLWALSIIFVLPFLFFISHKSKFVKLPKAVLFPCLVYSMFLGLTVASTLSLYITAKTLPHLLAFIAAIFFTISDSTLLIRSSSETNERKSSILMYVVLLSYYIAQNLFAITIFLRYP
jgi:uncharacterized membrane protein YhhN